MRDTHCERLVTFASVHHAIKAEKALRKAGIDAYSMPTPREIEVSCGLALAFSAACQAEVLRVLGAEGVVWSKLYRRDANLRLYEKIYDYEGDADD